MSQAAVAPEKPPPARGAVDRGPVSPELVLVDPELAGIERMRLRERALIEPLEGVSTPRVGTEPSFRREHDDRPRPETPPRLRDRPRRSRTLLPCALLLAIFGSGLALSLVVLGDHGQGPTPAVVEAAPPVERATPPQLFRLGVPYLAGSATRAIEEKVLSLVLRSAGRTLPPRLIDSSSGLPKNNVHVVCRREMRLRSFMCAVGLAQRGGGGVYVRYRSHEGGPATLTWYDHAPSSIP